MNNLTIIEQNGMRVLTTAQLADSYGTTPDKISYNFKYNENRYKEGKHFYLLTGEELKAFKNANREFQGSLNRLYLWTEKGAWLHAKSLNTDEAWSAYETLVDDYYAIQQSRLDTTQLSPELQMFSKIFNSLAQNELENKKINQELLEVKKETAATQEQVKNISEIVALNPREWRKETTSILNKIALKTGGYEQFKIIRNESYELLEQRANANLKIRVINKQKKMALEGVSKSKINNVSKLDAIDDDKRLLEIYLAVVKEMAIKYQVEVKEEITNGK